MGISNTLSVKVWTSSDECEDGFLEFESDDIIIKLNSGKILSGRMSDNDIFFEVSNLIVFDDSGESVIQPLYPKYKIQLKPHLMILHPYTNQGIQFLEDIFPPSTAGFYGRMQAGKEKALYSIQKIKDNDQFWLSISNPQTGQIYETRIIQLYEAEALSIVDDLRIRRAPISRAADNRSKSRAEILSILDTPSPSWQELSRLLGDVSVPNLTLGKTMRDTLTQVVPSSFPQSIREELMTFLVYVIKGEIPTEDPLTYSFKFSSMNFLEQLLNGHLMHLIDGTEWPSYVKLMTLAERGELDLPKRAISDSIKDSPWLLFSEKCAEHLSNWQDIVVTSARQLNQSGKIVLSLPTTRSSAKKSRKSWKKRFAEMSNGLRVYGHINPSSLGMMELVYLGSAYRWTHRHMKFITRLGGISENSPHMQVMIVPVAVVEQIKRALPIVMNVNWSIRTTNLDLFDTKLGKWQVPVEKLADSLEKANSMKKLEKDFGGDRSTEIYPLSKEESKIIDLVAEGVDLAFLELPEYLSNWGCDEKLGRKLITNLVNRKIMKLTYEVKDSNLVSLAIIAQGGSGKVTSLGLEFLKNTPTSHVRIDETGENLVILTRLPGDSVYDIASQLTSRGLENEVNIRCMRPTTFRRYTSNLYQRLLKDDGTWDDDVSAFLSQARSKRKELSESNA